MRVILVEDDEIECAKYQQIIEDIPDVSLIAVTNSSNEAIKIVNTEKPDAIVLDIELNNGEGSGIEFLQGLKELNLNKYPKIVVITNIYSDAVYNFLHKNKADFIFYKNQEGYSPKNVIDTLLLLNGYEKNTNIKITTVLTENGEDSKVSELINKELDLIGIATHLKGRKYLFDAISYVIENNEHRERISVIQFLVSKYKRANSTISRAMQNAILHAWRISSIEDLTELYTARINYETGVPTPTEFIYYYADKIMKLL